MKHKISGAIFDMDGTLIDSLGFWNVLWQDFDEKYSKEKSFCPSAEDDKAVRTMTLKAAMDYIHEKYNLAGSGDELLDEANRMCAHFYSNIVLPKEGAMDFLEHLHNAGVKMCIASATDRNLLKLALKHCDLEKYFSAIFSCADIGKGKDEPDIFFTALDHLGTDIKTTWVFEDSAVAVVTADKAGFKTVGIYDKFNYGHEIIKKTATEYVADGETLLKLI